MLELRSIIYSTLLAAFVAAAIMIVAQQFWLNDLLTKAEQLQANQVSSVAAKQHGNHHHGQHHHGDKTERVAVWQSFIAHFFTAWGYGLLLCGLIHLGRRRFSWQIGLLAGFGGFIVFMLAPSLGLPPSLPGSPLAPLEARQMWWLLSVLCGIVALWMLFQRSMRFRAAAIAVASIPYIIVSPPESSAVLLPQLSALNQQFFYITLLTTLVFWLLLGSISGWMLSRLARS